MSSSSDAEASSAASPERCFTSADQTWFGDVSGDVNPMHVDAMRARRTQAGAPVVHGMHAAIWALDELARSGGVGGGAFSLEIRFRRFVYVGEPVTLRLRGAEGGARLSLVSRGLECSTMRLRITDPDPKPGLEPSAPPVAAVGAAPLDLGLEELAKRSGAFIAPDAGPLAARYPSAAATFGASRLSALAGLSTLVGMLAPGLHSIFDGVRLVSSDGQDATIRYEVETLDDRFRKLSITVRAPGMRGTVDAYVRHPPVPQLTLAAARALVDPAEFSGVSSLVVGGSRGLGAATATLLAAGGARVHLTYRVGQEDANVLARELGPNVTAHRYDALEAAEGQLPAIGAHFDEAYYFATAPIAEERAAHFSPERFRELSAVYVDGFASLVEALAITGHPTRVFYPSSVYVTERPRKMTEYAMAKAAGEVLASDLGRAHPSISVLSYRLPRVLTDQTASVMPSEADDASTVMLPIVRRLRSASPLG